MHEYGRRNEAVLAASLDTKERSAGHRPAGEGCYSGSPLRSEEPAAGDAAGHRRHGKRYMTFAR